jgi:hypothetical protein
MEEMNYVTLVKFRQMYIDILDDTSYVVAAYKQAVREGPPTAKPIWKEHSMYPGLFTR